MCERIRIIEKLKIEKKPYVDILISSLNKYGIKYIENEGILDNVIFIKDKKVCKISHELFFRYYGRSVYLTKEEKTEKMTDKLFYEWYKVLILYCLGIEKI